MGPTLPRYMVTIIISFPQRFSMEVRFLLNPTVAVALTVSYTISITSASVTTDKRIVDNDAMIKTYLQLLPIYSPPASEYFSQKLCILLITYGGKHRYQQHCDCNCLHSSCGSHRRAADQHQKHRNDRRGIGQILLWNRGKPAVRVVTAWNRDAQIRCGTV